MHYNGGNVLFNTVLEVRGAIKATQLVIQE